MSLVREGHYPSNEGSGTIVRNVHDRAMNLEIFTTIYVGSDRQPFRCTLDTGSDYLWIQSRLCYDPDCGPWSKFDERTSTTYQTNETIQE